MSRLHWMGTVAAVAALSAPAAADAATSTLGARATARAYAAAVQRGDVKRLCTLVPWSYRKRSECREWVAADLSRTMVRRARVSAFQEHGAQARAVVDTVAGPRTDLEPGRTRIALERRGGRWGVIDNGPLPGVPLSGRSGRDRFPQPRSGALRRLADDALVALSSTVEPVCALLAPGAPLGPADGGCQRGALGLTFAGNSGFALRLSSFAVHPTAPGRARIDAVVAVTRGAGASLRTARWSDRLHAVRRHGRWWLLKPSRSFYRVLGVPEPADVDSGSATATWPAVTVPQGSISERATPRSCRRPIEVWSGRCHDVQSAGFASRPDGGGLVAWTAGWAIDARPVAAGAATGPVMPVLANAGEGNLSLVPGGLVPVAEGGALALVRAETTAQPEIVLVGGPQRGAVSALPLDRDGRPRGPAQAVTERLAEDEDDDGIPTPTVIASAPGASVVTLLTDDGRILRLGPDGRRAAPDVALPPDDGRGQDADAIVAEPDGALMAVVDDGGEIAVAPLGRDGRPGAGGVRQLVPVGSSVADSPAAAVDAEGRVLIAWMEQTERGGRTTLRAWSYDPRAPLASAPVSVATLRTRAVNYPADGVTHVAVQALAGGGWGVAYKTLLATGADTDVWAARLTPDGAVAAGPRRVGEMRRGADYGWGFGVAGDTVAWVETPAVGFSQVRAAPLP